ncbi:carbohydrate-binding module family 13 protein [Sphaerobolus stellatus SS14]|uniref:Carbohydrate-binding module family 13 protein n=1 Tax=Sphaerobolus stellatus (strain SS14) TaxID=990650 RepID=A0A0C9UTM0_SPHS4|nr:carbohydrate-binding module family 13 protein [Sphaerobolus stellatus SS14]
MHRDADGGTWAMAVNAGFSRLRAPDGMAILYAFAVRLTGFRPPDLIMLSVNFEIGDSKGHSTILLLKHGVSYCLILMHIDKADRQAYALFLLFLKSGFSIQRLACYFTRREGKECVLVTGRLPTPIKSAFELLQALRTRVVFNPPKMHSFFAIAAVSATLAVAQFGLPNTETAFQIQPTFRGDFPRTTCLTVFEATNGSAPLINDCTTITQDRAFLFSQPPGQLGQIKIFNTFCLEATGTNNGAKIVANACQDGNVHQQWLWNTNGVVQWGGFLEMCLDLTDGDLRNGNQVQIWECTSIAEGHSNQNQIWSANMLNNPFNEVFLAARDTCMGARSSDNGSPVFGVPCTDTTAHKVWRVPQFGHGNAGSIQVSFGTDGGAPVKCLDVTDGVINNGTKLQVWDCNGGINQQWFPTGTLIRWEGTSLLDPLCIDLTDGIEGNQLQIWNCAGGPNSNQMWFGVPPAQSDI